MIASNRSLSVRAPLESAERFSLFFALGVAWVATLGSLYFSEVMQLVPCKLCWYQRILMYPMALLIPIGLLRRDEHLPYYTLSLSALGILVSAYHYLLQKTSLFTAGAVCGSGVPCNFIDWEAFGFATIPFLALVGFLLIFFASLVVLTARRPVWGEDDPAPWAAVLGVVALVLLAFLPGFLGIV